MSPTLNHKGTCPYFWVPQISGTPLPRPWLRLCVMLGVAAEYKGYWPPEAHGFISAGFKVLCRNFDSGL